MAPSTPLAERDSAQQGGLRPRPAVRPEESRRPLYICARLKARVDADGAALRVRGARRAEARYPLSRVSRVIASTCVDWSAAALQVCLEWGIPIIIAGGSGAPLGSIQPLCVSVSQFSEDLEELLDRPDWREIYDNWLRAVRMRMVGEWRSVREATGQALAPGEFGETVRKFVYAADGAIPFEVQTEIWRAALCAMAASTLHRAGLQTIYWGAGATALHLLDDVTRLLELRLRLEIGCTMERGIADEAIALMVLHAVTPRLDAQCGWLLTSLARHLKQVLSEWR